MLRELELLEKSEIIESYEILDYKEGRDFYFLKIRAKLIDGSVLHIREFVSDEEYNYSFQWQRNGELIIRWDNAPHHRDLPTFPHHKHVGSDKNVLPSSEITLEEVLKAISSRIQNP
ncbi:hypothetical protein A3L11_08660 [Thermococcus siculi]|uniref:Uncharacterized protein n=1 Tax=Thermococcus siculi TaxID=72803 RepID=A0A2Z2MNS9_9EURY|nr:DUF6516 family protein [Thermococcus siculi]ASJ09295.1 hypothetical protein A3L11_08660 [Thermococcus siculi]